MRPLGRDRRDEGDIWPGFVDALSGLLIIVLFVVMVFMVAQFFLTNQLSGQERTIARLNAAIAELAEALSLKQEEAEELESERAQLRTRLQATLAQLAQTESEVEALAARNEALQEEKAALQSEVAALTGEREELAGRAGRLEEEKEAAEQRATGLAESLGEQEAISEEALAEVQLLNQQIAALRSQLAAVQNALAAAESKMAEQRLEIANLGERLNIALAAQVEELRQYRSEFFGRLRQVLGERSDIRIVGDRFIFQSELLFPTAEAELNESGKEQLAQLAGELKEIASEIPDDIDWILQVEGHTDERPIQTTRFPSNWELSTARAIAVVTFLVDEGIPPHRLSATGYGEYQPIDERDTPEAFAKNRRIELKFTQH